MTTSELECTILTTLYFASAENTDNSQWGQSRLLHHVTASRACQSGAATCRWLRASLSSVAFSRPPTTLWNRLHSAACLRPSTCGLRQCCWASVSWPERNSKSLQNRNAYLLADQGCLNALYQFGPNSRGLLLPLRVMPSGHPQHLLSYIL
jgi:hypothetical protein